MTTVFVHTINGRNGKWSKYLFPFSVERFGQLGDDLYIRSGDKILRVVAGLLTDHVDGVEVEFSGLVQYPWIDGGLAGATKMMEGVDLVASGDPSVSIGYDQRNTSAFTTPYQINPDTMPGGIIPIPVMGPSFSLRINFAGGTAWSLKSANLYLEDTRGQP